MNSSVPVVTESPNSNVTTAPLMPGSGGGIQVQWYVGGGTTVDHTFLAWHLPSGSLTAGSASAGAVDTENWSLYMKEVLTSGVEEYFDAVLTGDVKQKRAMRGFPAVASLSQSGRSRWNTANAENKDGVFESSSTSEDVDHYHSSDPLKPQSMYSATVNPSHHTPTGDRVASFAPGVYWLIAWSVVDAEYAAVGQGQPASMGPQSHYSNARSNSKWKHEQKTPYGRVVQGRRYWPSDPIVVVVQADGTHYVQSQVMHCNYWNRVQLTNHSLADSGNHPRKHDDAPIEQKTSDGDGVVYFTSENSELNSTSAWKLHHPYAVGAMLFILLLACFMTLLSNWRRNRIYTSLLNNKYINLTTSTSNSNIERMRALSKFPVRK